MTVPMDVDLLPTPVAVEEISNGDEKFLLETDEALIALTDSFLHLTPPSQAKAIPIGGKPELTRGFAPHTAPYIAVLKELIELDTNSESDIQKLHDIFEYGDNQFFEMREDETLVAAEVFDRVGFFVQHLVTLHQLWFMLFSGPELFDERLQAPQPMSGWASEGVRPMWPSAEKLLDLSQQSY